jgi:SNF2 family DNA or RNA helicase
VKELHPYQQRALDELRDGKRALFLPYGTGKSRIALKFSVYGEQDIVIFCKLRNVATWQREIHKWYPGITDIVIVRGSKKERISTWSALKWPPHILIIPYSIVLKDKIQIQDYLNVHPPATIIADESTTIKNPNAGVTKQLLKARQGLPEWTNCLILSGNPIPEHPKEIWTQAAFAYGTKWTEHVGSSFYRFMKQWFVFGQYGSVLKISREKEYTSLLEKFGIWLAEAEMESMRSVAGFPTANYIIEEFDIEKPQKDALVELFDDWALTYEEQVDEYNYIMTLQMKAQQICSGFFIQQDGSVALLVTQAKNNKVIALYDIVHQLMDEKAARKIIVWRKFVAETVLIERQLQEFGCVIGPDEESLEIFMKDPGIHIIIMPVDCSQGFNELAVADTSIFFSNSYSVDSRTQAEARIERQGQKANHVTHIDLCTRIHRDREIITMLQAKDFSPQRLKASIIRDRTRFWKDGSAVWHTPGDIINE